MVAPVGRIVPVTVRRPAELRRVDPAAPPEHTVDTTRRARGIGDGVGGITVIPVTAPFPDVAMHVEKAKGVGFLLADGMGLLTGVFNIPGILGKLACTIAKTVCRVRSATTGIFPFRFGGEAEVFAGPGIELVDEVLDVVPGDVLHREAVALEMGGVGAHDGFPLGLSDFIFTHVKAVRNSDAMLWVFPTITAFFRGWGAHPEGSRRNPAEAQINAPGKLHGRFFASLAGRRFWSTLCSMWWWRTLLLPLAGA